jgi:LPXTG-site transpeptidase (sortase) family protein
MGIYFNRSIKNLIRLNIAMFLVWLPSMIAIYLNYQKNITKNISSQTLKTVDSTSQNILPTPTITPTPIPTPTPTPIPLGINIPKINVNAEIMEVGIVKNTKEMEVPQDADIVGWYKYGPTPGQPGASVLNAHYDTPTGAPAIFYNLTKLQVGDEFYITNDQNKQLKYIVKEIINAPLNNFPIDKIYGERDYSQVTLITCAGVWNASTRLYSNRLAVIAQHDSSSDTEQIAYRDKTSEQFVLEAFKKQEYPRSSNMEGAYLRIVQEEDVASLYLATNNNEVTTIDALIQYDPQTLSIEKDMVSFTPDFETYYFNKPSPNLIQIALFTDPSRKSIQALNTKDKEIKIAEIKYKKLNDYSNGSRMDIIKQPFKPTSAILTTGNGLDIHTGIDILNQTESAILRF